MKNSAQNVHSFNTHYGSPQDDIGNCIIQTMTGGYVIVGKTTGFNAYENDILLTKTDSLGVPIWNKTLGGVSVDIGKAVTELFDSSLVLIGYSNSFGNGGYDAIIYHVDKNGNKLWQKTFGGTDWDFGYSINKTNDNNLIICGTTYSFGRGGIDGFVIKMDYAGNFLWQKIYGGFEDDTFNKVIPTSEGGYIIAGTTKSYGDSLEDIWVAKVDANGDSLWFVTRGGIKRDIGNSVVQDLNNDYLITGGSESFSNGKEDAYIFKLSNSGSFIWQQYYGMATEDEESFDILNSGSNYGNMLITFGTKEQFGNGYDIKTILLDFGGNYVRGGSFGGSFDDLGYSLFNTKDKGYIVCGYTESFGSLLMDVFIVKYDSEMTIGPLFVSIKENDLSKKFKIYPTVILDQTFYIENNTGKEVNMEIFDIYAQKVNPVKIESRKNNLLQITLPDNVKGIVFIRLNNRSVTQKCIIN